MNKSKCERCEAAKRVIEEAKQMARGFADGKRVKIDQNMREATIDGVPVSSTARQFLANVQREGF